MSISFLQLDNCRNIVSTSIPCPHQFNLFFGDNGAGKTAILEAIYYLSCGKSFRTNHIDHIIHEKSNELTVFAKLKNGSQLGIQKTRDSTVSLRYNNDKINNIAQFSQSLPVQFIGTTSHRILLDGPKSRRQFLDWGLFHTCPHFYPQWREFQKLLVQRNAMLKSRASLNELYSWNHVVANTGEALTALRKNYIAEFLPYFNHIISIFLKNIHMKLNYTQGWSLDCSLLDSLNKNVSRETIFGYTLYGPHRADLTIEIDNIPAQEILSQGQQKLVSYALRLAQGLHFHEITKNHPIYLIDDMPSELDKNKRTLVAKILNDIGAQVFLTAVEKSNLDELIDLGNSKMFHVKHGELVTG